MPNTLLIKRSGTASAAPSTLATGELALNYNDGLLYYKNASNVIVPLSARSGNNVKLNALTFNGSTTTFALVSGSTAVTPLNANALLISLNGVIQEPGVSFTVSGSNITFSVAPAATDTFFGVHITTGGTTPTTDASLLTAGTLPNARLSSAIATYANIHQRVFSAPTAGIDVYPRTEVIANVTQATGIANYTFFTPSETVTVSAITMASGGTAAAGVTLARMGLYTFDEGTTALTLVARTASDTTLFTTSGTAYTRSFDTTGGYPASYTLLAGTRYGVAVFVAGTTLPQIAGKTINLGVTNLVPRTAGATASATDLAASPGLGNQGGHVWARLT